MDRLFTLLFKYPPVVFQRGELVLAAASSHVAIALVLGLATAAYGVMTYRRVARVGARRGLALVSLRLVVVALLVGCLLEPSLVVKAAVPQQNFLGVLLDDSRSFQIADRDGRPRSEFVRQQLATGGALAAALGRKFAVRYFRFASSADRIESPSALAFDGTATRLGPALDRARDELAGLPLAGLVVVSDGADTSNAPLDEALARLKSRSIPVFTVGVGAERMSHDVQLTRVDAPRATLKGNTLVVNVAVTQAGYAGRAVPITVEDDGHLVASQTIELPPDGETLTVPVRVTTRDAGARTLRFAIAPQPREQVAQNNAREVLLDVRDRREKILYIEGEPRFEAKFVRQAVEKDANLDVVLLQRTAKDKYLRLGVDRPDELVGGFPKTREELFEYRAVILGSIEADSFTPEQIRMLADFVDRRGGGLLTLGGRRSFGEGGWAGTPLADVLPVEIQNSTQSSRSPQKEIGPGSVGPVSAVLKSNGGAFDVAVRPTREGLAFPLTQIADTDEGSAARWKQLPPLTSVNRIRRVKPGATVLLSGGDRDGQVVLAYQRYGRGKVAALPVQDVWQWRMNAAMSVDDTTHATFWRRLLRWLVEDVPGPVVTTTAHERVEPGDEVALTARVADKSYLDVNDARVIARVTGPSGTPREVPLTWDPAHDGEYRGSFVADTAGAYSVEVDATRGTTSLGTDHVDLRAAPGDAEYFDAAMRAPLLQRIADETGGRYFAADNVSGLADAISYSGGGVTVVEQRALWDMPVVLVLLAGLASTEWALRRQWGLA